MEDQGPAMSKSCSQITKVHGGAAIFKLFYFRTTSIFCFFTLRILNTKVPDYTFIFLLHQSLLKNLFDLVLSHSRQKQDFFLNCLVSVDCLQSEILHYHIKHSYGEAGEKLYRGKPQLTA